MSLYDWYEIKSEYAEIKFSGPIKVASLINGNFTVFNTTSGTPVSVISPFKNIDVKRDYSSISRILRLWWNTTLTADSDYRITISNILGVDGLVISSENIDFSTEPGYVPDDSLEEPPTRNPIEVEDYSIKDTTLLVEQATPSSSSIQLSIDSIDPDTSLSYYLAEGYKNGVISVTFDEDINTDFISSTYFILQRKNLNAYISRWEDIVTQVIQNPDTDKGVLIQLPSTEADLDIVYDTVDRIYWEQGYKYRLRMLSAVSSISGKSLLRNKEIIFLSQLSPLYFDAEKLIPYFDSIDLVEATQIIYAISSELYDIFGSTIEITPLVQEYIKAATLCELSKIYVFDGGMSGFSNSDSFMLGDLQVMKKSGGNSNSSSRGTVGSWCELAALLREEVFYKKTGIVSVTKAENRINPIPDRTLRRFD